MAAFSFPARLVKIHATPKPVAGGLELGVRTIDVTDYFDSHFEGLDAIKEIVDKSRHSSQYTINADLIRGLLATGNTLRSSVYDRPDDQD